MLNRKPIQFTGLGLRHPHYQTILDTKPPIPWFEALTDNYLNDPTQRDILLRIRQDYPITLHGVGLSLGSTDPLNQTYLRQFKSLIDAVEPTWVSDHLSWSSVSQHHLHDLLPLPMTQETIDHVSDRIQSVQDYLGCQILVENPSSYMQFDMDAMPEWAFVNAIAEKADCHILLDINNIYVSARNQSFDPHHYLNQINQARVKQYHLAGFTDMGDYLFDQHSQAIHASVWSLYQEALAIVGIKPTLVERDDNIPPLNELMNEVDHANQLIELQQSQHANTP